MSRGKAAKRLTRREKSLMREEAQYRRMQEYASFDYETATPVVQQTQTPKLEPKNSNQKLALSYLNSGKPVVFLTGSAGTGKSLLAAYRAASLLKSKKIKKVYLVRPAVSVGKSVGLLPGEIKDKLGPYFAQTLAHLEKFLGKTFLEYCLKDDINIIEMKPVEYLRGMSFEDCMVIAEEVQNFTAEEMEMMLTRLGENCTIVFTGDTKQHDLKGVSGLELTIKLLNRIATTHPEYMTHDDLDELDDGIGIVQFKPEDVVRSGLTKAFVRMYYYND